MGWDLILPHHNFCGDTARESRGDVKDKVFSLSLCRWRVLSLLALRGFSTHFLFLGVFHGLQIPPRLSGVLLFPEGSLCLCCWSCGEYFTPILGPETPVDITYYIFNSLGNDVLPGERFCGENGVRKRGNSNWKSK